MNTSKPMPRGGTIALLLIGAGLGAAHADRCRHRSPAGPPSSPTSAGSRDLHSVPRPAVRSARSWASPSVWSPATTTIASSRPPRPCVPAWRRAKPSARSSRRASTTWMPRSPRRRLSRRASGRRCSATDQIGLDVGFRTDEDAIPEQALSPLLKIGALAADMNETVVRVAGYADPRGSDEYNQALSLRRAQAVAALLTGGRRARRAHHHRGAWQERIAERGGRCRRLCTRAARQRAS